MNGSNKMKSGAGVAFKAAWLVLLMLTVCMTPAAWAANFTWDPGNNANGAVIDPASGNWDLTSPFWNTGTTDVAWAQTNATTGTNTAIFGGADGTYNISLTTGLAATGLTFNNSGYTLSATSAQTLTVITGAVATVATGKTATIGANVTLASAGSLFLVQPNVSTVGGGTLILENGSIVSANGTMAISGPGSTVTVNAGGLLRNINAGSAIAIGQPKTGGVGAVLNVNGGTVTTAGGAVLLGNATNTGANAGPAVGTLNLTAGTVTIGGAGALQMGGGATDATNTATATLNMSGASTLTTGTGGVAFALAAAPNSTGTINLNGGTLVTNKFVRAAGTATLNLNGGTIKASATNATYMTGLTAANVNAGGVTFDTNSFNITVGQALLAGSPSGGLTKQGAGILTLSGANTYTGATNVNVGTLQVDGSLNAGSTVTVGTGATLTGIGTVNGSVVANSGSHIGAATATTAGTFNVGALTLNTGAAADFEFGGTSDLINVVNAGGLNLAGGTVNVFNTGGTAALSTAGTYTLFDYNGTFTGNLANLTVANALAGKQYTFSNDTVNTLIKLTIVDTQSEWNGAAGDGLWSTSGNWTSGVPNAAGFNALFGTIPGSPTSVAVNGPKTVGAMTFNNLNAYTINGGAGDVITLASTNAAPAALNVLAGSHTINAPLALSSDLLATVASGSTLLVAGSITGASKNLSVGGGGTLQLTGVNTYTNTSITGATLQIGDGTTLGNLGTGSIALGAAGKLIFNHSDNVTIGNNITGVGTFQQDGAGTTTLSGNNAFGAAIVNAGTLKAGVSNGLGGAGLTVNNSATVDLNGFDATIASLAGTGGTVSDNSGAAGTTTLTVNQAGNTNYSGAINNGANRTLALTKQGAGTLILDGSVANGFTGVTTVASGTLALGKSGVLAINGNVNIGDTVGSDVLLLNASDQIADYSVLSFTAGGSGNSAFLRLNGNSETVRGIQTTVAAAAVIENVTANGGIATLTVDTAGNSYTYDGILRNGTGSGLLAITKNGAGTLTIANTAKVAVDSQSGVTTVNNGTLILDNLDSYASPFVNNSAVADGLTFNQTTRNLALGAALSISGSGGVTKTGAGSLTLASSINSYTGPTNVNGGSLIVNGSINAASNVTVANTASVGGTGTIGGLVTVNSGGHVGGATSTTAGTINVGALTLSSGSLLDYEFGATSDLINVNNAGGLTINGGAFNLFGTGGVSALTTNGTYTLIDYNTNYNGSIGSFTINNGLLGKLYTFNDDTINTLITLTVADNASEWNGLAGDGKWSTAGNWTNNIVPNVLGVKALFGQIPTSPTSVAVNGPKIVSGIVFDNSNSYTVTGSTGDVITLDAGAIAATINVVSGNHTLAAPIALNSDLAVTVASGSTFNLGSPVSGTTKNLAFSGAGTLVLGGANSYGTTTVNNGTLQVGDGVTSGTLGAGAVTLGVGTTLSFNRTDTLTVTNNIGGVSANVRQDGTGVTVLSGVNTFGTTANGLTINAGTLRVGSATGLPSGVRATLNGGKLDLGGNNVTVSLLSGGAGVVTDDSATAGTSSITIFGENSGTFSGTIANGAGGRVVSLVRDDNATPALSPVLSGNNTYTGGTLINRGYLTVSSNTALGTGDITITSASIGAGDATRLYLTNGVTLSNNINFTTAANGLVSGVLSVPTDGVTATFAGAITFNGSPLSGGHVSGPGTSGMLNITGPVSGTGNFQQRSGFVRYFGGGTYTAMNLTGNGSIGANNGLSTAAVVNIGASGASTLDLNGFNQTLAGILQGAGAATVTNTGAAPSTLTLNTSVADAYIGTIVNGSQPVSLTKMGTAAVTLSATSTYTGATTVNNGLLKVTGAIATTPITVNGPGVFEAAVNQTVQSLTVNLGGTANVTTTGARTVLKVGDGTATSSPLTVNGKLDLAGNGLIVDVADGSQAAVLTAVRTAIIHGYNPSTPTAGDGTWNGNGITSASAAADSNSKGVGYALSSEVAGLGSFLGTTVDASAVVARYTLLGDATLDGIVDFNDLVQLAQNYNVVDGTRTWFTGDFTYDGNVDFNDLVKLAQNYNSALPSEPVPGASALFDADLARAFASVPEPASLGAIGLAGLALLRRGSRAAKRA